MWRLTVGFSQLASIYMRSDITTPNELEKVIDKLSCSLLLVESLLEPLLESAPESTHFLVVEAGDESE